jgi:hypothetical protein
MVARQQARLTLRDRDLDTGQPCRQRVQRPGMVGMGVREDDARDRPPEPFGRGQNPVGAAGEHGVHQRQAVILGDEIGVDKAKPRQPGQVGSLLSYAHRVTPSMDFYH